MKNKPNIIYLGDNGAMTFETCPEQFKDMFTAYYSEEFMFEFAKWINSKYIRLQKGWLTTEDNTSRELFTTKELLEEFKITHNGRD